MAYQFSCGFDFITTASQLWSTVTGTPTINSGNARFGGTHSQGASFSSSTVTWNTVGNQATLIVQFALKLPALPTGANTGRLIDLFDGATTQVSLVLNSSGALQFFRNGPTGTALGSAGSTNFSAAVWHYLEIFVTINNTTGVAQCWLDGVQIINGSSLNTRQSANNFANQVRIGDTGNLTNIVIDDVLIFDGTGGVLDNHIGDKRIITTMPNGAGAFTDFLAIGAASNYQCVDEIPANDNTDYVSSATTNARDSYAHESVTIAGNADFIVPWAKIAKDDASSHTVELSVTDTGNDAFSSAVAVPSSYGYINGGAFLTSPNGAAAWSQTVVNRTERGIKIIS